MSIRETLKIVQELGKTRISLPVSLSALAGFILLEGEPNFRAFLLAAGVFLMSCGSAALNHIQESKTDRLMSRTRKRPIPSGRISVQGAVVVAIFFVASGTVILGLTFPPGAVLLSWITLIWYNLIYTPLKKVTAFAVIPGSVTGALPPVIGWVAAGGGMLDQQIMLVASFFFIGQIPHFWLLLLMFGDQYKEAGFPTLNQIFSEPQIRRISFIWVLATMASALLVAGYVIQNKIIALLILLYILFLIVSLVIRFLVQPSFKPLAAFYRLNLLYLLMMLFLMADGWIRN
jgi:heme o synthase